jgi:sphinganine-1-phosphate aldolase
MRRPSATAPRWSWRRPARYAHGVVDPVREIAALAEERGALCHVDGCMGGFLLPYFQRLGAEVPDFDFRVPGVTSMSMDFHKYGLCPKGASVVLYRDEALRKHQIYACSEWTGYTMVNNTIQSTKSGGPWRRPGRCCSFLGESGYTKIATDLLAARDALVAGIKATPGLRLLGEPEMSMVAFTRATTCRSSPWPTSSRPAAGTCSRSSRTAPRARTST